MIYKKERKQKKILIRRAESAFLWPFLGLSKEAGVQKHGIKISSLRPHVRWKVAVWKAIPGQPRSPLLFSWSLVSKASDRPHLVHNWIYK